MNSWINVNALWKIVVIGLLAGAGLPALFAVGLRALAPRTRKAEDEVSAAGAGAVGAGTAGTRTVGTRTVGTRTVGTGPSSHRAGLLGGLTAVLCFAVILAAMGWGIYSIVHNS